MNFFRNTWNTLYWIFDGDILLMIMGVVGIVMFGVYLYVVLRK